MQKRLVYLDYLRIVSCFFVVLLHTIVSSIVLYGKVPLIEWDISIFISSLTRWTIPVFIMVSGALILGRKNEQAIVFIKKRLSRIGVPLLFWFLFYAFYRHIVNGLPFSFTYLLHQFVFNQPYEHLYFLVILLELMVITPILWKRELLVNNIFSIALLSLVTFFWIPNRFFVFQFVPYVSYYVLGYLLSKINMSRLLKPSVFVSIFFILITFLFTRHITLSGITNNLYFFSFTNPIVFITSVSVFILFKELLQKEKERKVITIISSYTMGIYLIHPFILYTLQYCLRMKNMIYILFSPAISLLVFAVSLFVVFLFSKIPFICKVVGFSSKKS